MEQLIQTVIEKSLVGGAFLYLLYMFIARFSKSQDMIVEQMTNMVQQMISMSKALSDVSNTLSNLDERVRKLEGKEHE